MDKKNKHIAFLIASSSYGGYEVRYFKLAYYLYTCGYKVSVLVNVNLLKKKGQAAIDKILSDEGFRKNIHTVGGICFTLNQKLTYFLLRRSIGVDAFLFFSKKKLKEINADVVYSPKPVNRLEYLKENANLKIVKDFISPASVNGFFKKKNIFHTKNIDFMVFISKSVEEKFYANLEKFIGKKEVQLPPTFTAPTPFFFPVEIEKSDVFDKKENLMIFAHRLLKRKNPVLFAQLVKKMCTDSFFDEWKFGLFGRGEMYKEIESLLRQEFNEGRVEIGHKTNLISYLKRSKIFFSLIEPDNFPSQSVCEAMYCGNALVLLNTGRSNFFINNNGILVEKNVDLIYQQVKEMVQGDLEEKGKNSTAHIQAVMPPENYKTLINQILEVI